MATLETIRLRGVRQNNLQGFDLDLPLGKLIVVTGLSGAGKSSLVFETLHAEGQRRYVETFSAYTRQFLERLDRPRVDKIENIRPSIAIEQTNTVKTSRSTVGTMTELCDYFKAWWPHTAQLHDPDTGEIIANDNPRTIWRQALGRWGGKEVLVAFAVAKPKALKWAEIFGPLRAQGYARAVARVEIKKGKLKIKKADGKGQRERKFQISDFRFQKDGQGALKKSTERAQQDCAPTIGRVARLEDLEKEAGGWAPGVTLLVIQDRVGMTERNELRFLEAARTALHFGQGALRLLDETGAELGRFSEGLHSPHTGRKFRPATPGMFSFNSPMGACAKCRGFGRVIELDERLVTPDTKLTIAEGVLRPFQGEVYGESKQDLIRVCKKFKIPTEVPWREMTAAQREFVMAGEPGYKEGMWKNHWYGVRRFFTWLETQTYKMHVRVFLSKYRTYNTCPECHGARLKEESLWWKWRGKTLPEVYGMTVEELLAEMEAGRQESGDRRQEAEAKPRTLNAQRLTLNAQVEEPANGRPALAASGKVETPNSKVETHQSDLALEGIVTRLQYLREVGLGYLSLDRATRTLSGGETERVNLTTCLGSSLVETLFVLDEPSVGLHPRDINRLIGILRRLADAGNTVVVVEHDEAVMRAADHIVEIGPLPGKNGGRLVFSGTVTAMMEAEGSLTGKYLSGELGMTKGLRDQGTEGQREMPRTLNAQRLTFNAQVAMQPENAKGKMQNAKLEPEHKQGGKTAGKLSSLIPPPSSFVKLEGVTLHNLRGLDVAIPCGRLVGLCGVSGSGKSTLLKHALYQSLRVKRGEVAEEPAVIKKISMPKFAELMLVDQSPVSRTPRSNAALYSGAWEGIRGLFAAGEAAMAAGFTAREFSFNAGEGRCPHCQGLGSERVEMQFMSDLYVPCPECGGKRFKPEVLACAWNGHSVAQVLAMEVGEAVEVFAAQPKIALRLRALMEVGLSYLPLGQPLNTLSGGESQRLKLVRYLGGLEETAGPSLLLLDEPTTGLHRDDVGRLLQVLHKLVHRGHSVIVVEHQLDVLGACDWLIELGPEAGAKGGKIVAEGTPEEVARAGTETGIYLKGWRDRETEGPRDTNTTLNIQPLTLNAQVGETVKLVKAAETVVPFGAAAGTALRVVGAREHNLQNISIDIPRREFVVLTGVSGSGKSTLAFDIIFAEGQRRFMESMSAYARQFVEQMPRPDVDEVAGLPPTVAIEQRVTRGGRKSTVATVTEVAPYLRLLYARLGVPHSLVTGLPLVALGRKEMAERVRAEIGRRKGAQHLYMFAPLVRGRKGHHQPLADWAGKHGYELLRCDGKLVRVADFQKLDRYREHDVEVAVADFGVVAEKKVAEGEIGRVLDGALKIGGGACFLLEEGEGRGAKGEGKQTQTRTLNAQLLTHNAQVGALPGNAKGKMQKAKVGAPEARAKPIWFSVTRTDPATGEAYPELDPKHFSWNSMRGWCPRCRGYGRLFAEVEGNEDLYAEAPSYAEPTEEVCPDCQGARLNPVSRAVKLYFKNGTAQSLPELVALAPADLLKKLEHLQTDARGKLIAGEVIPQMAEKLKFLDRVGLDYLTLDRSAETLSGGEAQRIRLAGQLGSNLAGVLYVLDEPSIGLHARDNARLIESLRSLQKNGNSLLVVEHDEDTLRQADRIIDLGPGAGVHGGKIVAQGTVGEILRHPESVTAQCLREGLVHPRRGAWRPVGDPKGQRDRGTKGPGGMPKTLNAQRLTLNAQVGAGKETAKGKMQNSNFGAAQKFSGEIAGSSSSFIPLASSFLVVRGARLRNLMGGDEWFPLGRLVVVSGPSGAGKSTLVRDVLEPAAKFAAGRHLKRLEWADFARATGARSGEQGAGRGEGRKAKGKMQNAKLTGQGNGDTNFRFQISDFKTNAPQKAAAGKFRIEPENYPPWREVVGADAFKSVIEVGQDPIGQTPRSTPATYIGAFEHIRALFAQLPEARLRGHEAGWFSFNTKGGRCETCAGAGRVKLEMSFLPEAWLPCEDCGGDRYGAELRELRWNGKNLAEVLRMSFEEAAEFFSAHRRLKSLLDLMNETGLGYLTLGQSSPTLSGGEAQRLKLVSELTRGLPNPRFGRPGDRHLYILEEPTIGLHQSDVARLIDLLHRLVDQGHTVVVIEHHLDIIAEADWVLELGPVGGEAGGEIMYQGPVAGLAKRADCPTGPYLKGKVGGRR